MATTLKTPGVYIEEKNAFPNSVVEVPTAVPAFVGYTEKALNGTKSLINSPFRITSLSEYQRYFGFGPTYTYALVNPLPDNTPSDFSVGGKDYYFDQQQGKFLLYRSIRHFYDNGGGPCYIVSVGSYTGGAAGAAGPVKPFQEMSNVLNDLYSEANFLNDASTVASDDAAKAAVKVMKGMLPTFMAQLNALNTLFTDVQDAANAEPFKSDPDVPGMVTTLKTAVDPIADPAAITGIQTAIDTMLATPTSANVTAFNGKITALPGSLSAGAIDASDKLLIKAMILSQGGSAAGGANVEIGSLLNGINQLVRETEPTMLVVPDAMLLSKEDAYSLQQQMIDHCGNKMKSRVAILDIYNGWRNRQDPNGDPIADFRNGVASDFLKFAAAYYPWVYTTIVPAGEVTYRMVEDPNQLVTLLNAEVDGWVQAKIITASKATEYKLAISFLSVPEGQTNGNTKQNHETILAISPTYAELMKEIRKKINLLPPSGAMAGIYSRVDNARGVWKAPANVAVSSTISPAINITQDDQEDLNVTLQGKSVNAIRSFIGEGVLVWGARTLDGNSQDWRYVNVRRTMIMLEQSIKAAAKAYVFEPNDGKTWVSIKSMISNYLNAKWKEGALVGAKPEDAYDVQVGLGSTMTSNDILDGIMNITVLVAISRPAEFIVITFQQQMQKS